MFVYAVVTDEIDRVIEFYFVEEDAREMLAQVVHEEPDWENILRVERIELVCGTEN
jgi:hypothetical protein